MVASHGDRQWSIATGHHIQAALKASPHCLFLKNMRHADMCQLADVIHNSLSARNTVRHFV